MSEELLAKNAKVMQLKPGQFHLNDQGELVINNDELSQMVTDGQGDVTPEAGGVAVAVYVTG